MVGRDVAGNVWIIGGKGTIEGTYVGYKLILLELQSDFCDEAVGLRIELYAEKGHVSYNNSNKFGKFIE
jgi:hypothetical protein